MEREDLISSLFFLMVPNLQTNILQALVAEGRPEAMVNALKIAGPGSSYEQVFKTIMEMENNNLVKLVYCQHPSTINVQATLVGQAAAKSSPT